MDSPETVTPELQEAYDAIASTWFERQPRRGELHDLLSAPEVRATYLDGHIDAAWRKGAVVRMLFVQPVHSITKKPIFLTVFFSN